VVVKGRVRARTARTARRGDILVLFCFGIGLDWGLRGFEWMDLIEV
jgi:hypothetical protein